MLRAVLVSVHLVAAAGLLVVPPVWALPGATVLAASLALEWRRARFTATLLWRGDGSWLCGDEPSALGLRGATFLTPWVVVLVLAGEGGVRRIALLRDALPAQQWRRLRARLRVEGPACIAGEVEVR